MRLTTSRIDAKRRAHTTTNSAEKINRSTLNRSSYSHVRFNIASSVPDPPMSTA